MKERTFFNAKCIGVGEFNMNFLSKLTKFFDFMLDIMFVLAGLLLMFAMVSISVAIASRYFLGMPIGWVVEISAYIMLYITFLVAAWVLRDDGHISIDVVILMFRPKIRYLMDFITSIVGSIVFLIITWYGGKVSWDLFKLNYFTETMLELPKCIFIGIISFGSFTLSLQLLRRAHASLLKFGSHIEPEPTIRSGDDL